MWKYSCKYHKYFFTSSFVSIPPPPPPCSTLFSIFGFHKSIWNKKQIILSPNPQIWNKKAIFSPFSQIWKFTWIRFCCNCFCSVHFDHSLLTGLFVSSTAAKNKTTTSTSNSNSTKLPKKSQISLSIFWQKWINQPPLFLNITDLSWPQTIYKIDWLFRPQFCDWLLIY